MVRLQVRMPVQQCPPVEPPSLGHALHGLLERAVHQNAPAAEAIMREGQRPWYAIVAPPAGLAEQPLRWGIYLFGPLADRWLDVAVALCGGPGGHHPVYVESQGWLARIGQPAVEVVDVDGRLHPLLTATGLHESQVRMRSPPRTAMPPAATIVEMELLGPLTLTTKSKRAYGGRNEVPGLLSIAQSAFARLTALLPEWVPQIAMPDSRWEQEANNGVRVDTPAATRPAPVAHHTTGWWFPGTLGTLYWSGRFGPELLRLLELGQIVGVGQGTARGGGRYRLRAW